ncbi:MAG: acetoacetate--CoA ligase [Acidobacteriota bacterium]
MTEGPIWTPTPERAAAANLSRFSSRHLPGAGMAELWRWSVDHPEEFWTAVWEFGGVIGEENEGEQEGGSRWFPRARVNYAENLLRFRDERPALIAWSEKGRQSELSFADLAREVARYQAALIASGVAPGDRVAGYLPNIPETVIAALAAASIGAIWTSVSPDFGERAVLDRFGNIRPKVLFAATATRYAGRIIDLTERLSSIVAELPETERIVLVGDQSPAAARIPRSVPLAAWLDAVNAPEEPTFLRLPFDHPLYVVYSSGTTGLPKGIVHGGGGTLLQHLKELILHTDLRRDDRIFYFSTCGWMMWNWLISSLAVGATVVLYDGAPFSPRNDILWEMAEAERITIFGTSAKYLAVCDKENLAPGSTRDLSALRTILSTGSPLAPESYDYVYNQIKSDVHLASISGGTDLLSCFALGDPTGPVWRGELQCRGLGMAVEVWSPEGESLESESGELVCTRPFPSMPVAFWNDPEGAKYRAAYFEHFPNRDVWRHGDWAQLTEHGPKHRGLTIAGRSDATLNPGGVRIGTAEIYRQVERLPEILESLAVGQEWQGDVRIVLFVRLRPGVVLDDSLAERIRREIRQHASPHHVPKIILAVPDLPRTINGKLSELAVHAAIHGRALGNADALANPVVLDYFRTLPELHS